MFAVAIDGPSGVGKSTIAKLAAKKLGLLYVDTGAIYRTVGLYLLTQGIDIQEEKAVVAALPDIEVAITHTALGQRMLLAGRDVTDQIRTEEISQAVSKISAIPDVRSHLLHVQQELAEKQNVIMDGRDIGTVVLPWAQMKIFLTARAEVRARRRYEQLLKSGQEAVYQTVLDQLMERDERDSTRAVARLQQAPDAVLVDSSDQTEDETMAEMIGLISAAKEAYEKGAAI